MNIRSLAKRVPVDHVRPLMLAFRKWKWLTQEEAAKELGITAKKISSIETASVATVDRKLYMQLRNIVDSEPIATMPVDVRTMMRRVVA